MRPAGLPARRTAAVVLALVCGLAAIAPARAEQQADSVLGVESISGTASVEHLGARRSLQAGDRLNERDVIRTGPDGRLSLRFARLGFFELGPNSEIGVEKLPFASYAADLKSIFSLSRGYLRIVWKHLPTSASWPLYIYFGGQRAGLGAGEYFFDQRETATRVCVAAGQIAVVPVTGEAVETLRPPSCSRLFAGAAPESLPRDPEDWIAVRRDFSIDASSRSDEVAAAPAAAEPAPAPRPTPTPTPAPVSAPVQAVGAPPPAAAPAPAVAGGEPRKRVADAAPPAAVPAPRRSTTPAAVASAAASPETGSVATPPAPAPAPVPAAKPAVVAAPAPAAPAAPAGGELGWVVNVASYPESEAAARQVQQLKTAGFTASVLPVQVKGQAWYRVQVRGFASAEAARAKATELQDKLGFRNLWVVRQP